ncbi:ABC transporter substrate-binding protein [Truepera radiovictrix]|uniref:Extracellular solute-binding protein family 5 n=1 Tax=Truepera radiovictrix (strain DSM 17093 / CIP 108686 / LMG 22925 / RQ-24) TaxID=649638 RepID=D7CT62_TRURR|nr:ABC transporter substrate-binding protein [Truepera radiovictrix]ADI15525.1 extracellular solute-binding protein family 5 [Truepera radiovictrix DSM 17093]WMT55924.1 ABC transporter substrate-binding protein [Truepera radiovictrix]
MKRTLIVSLGVLLGLSWAQTVRVGLNEDPDTLDPDLSRTYVGRIVFASLCDKLFDISTDLEIIPQLATAYAFSEDNLSLTITLRDGVVFHDGTPLDAEAVRYNLERSKNLPGSNRASEIEQLQSVEVVDDTTVRLTLSQPFAPILAQLADRAGMMVSPTAAEEAGENFGNAPVCAGPFRFVERVAQDRIVLERFPDYWDAASIHLEGVVFLPIPDTSVRLANLQAGDLELIERPAPTDLETIRNAPNLELPTAPSLGYQGLTINLANPEPLDTPLATSPQVREALELALDRDIINQAVFDGEYLVGNQPVPPSSPWYNENFPIPERDVERARALLQEAGFERVAFELMVGNNPESVRLGEVIQALAGEAGFDITLRATEFATALDLQEQGQYEVFQIGWSGRLDPDGNIHQFYTCEGALNETGYCDEEVDRLLNEARSVADIDERKALYDEASARYLPNRNIIYLYHTQLFFPHVDRLEGFQPYPDGLLRWQGVTLN